MNGAPYRREFPADLARAGEARQFVAWLAAVAGLRRGDLSDFSVAAEAVLTDILLSGEDGKLEVESETSGNNLKITIRHPELPGRRMADLEGILEHFLDGYELSPTQVVLIKHLG